jgi:protein phosphatase
LALRFAARSDPGLLRERNEDCVGALPERGVFAVADGMGGHVGGDVASRVAIETALAFLGSVEPLDLDALAQAMALANRAVIEAALQQGLFGMGTTLTLAHVRGEALQIANVGDSRAYLIRAGRAELLTTDQTMVEMMIQQGMLRREQARRHPERHVLVQALGTQEQVVPELRQIRSASGDRLLLSTDGLHDQIGDDELLQLVQDADPELCADALVRAANQTGGPDNITVVLIEL